MENEISVEVPIKYVLTDNREIEYLIALELKLKK